MGEPPGQRADGPGEGEFGLGVKKNYRPLPHYSYKSVNFVRYTSNNE